MNIKNAASFSIPAPEALRGKLSVWFQSAGRDLPWRRTQDPYAIMVSEFMLQQTQVATVIGYFERWLARFPSFEALAAANEAEVLGLWAGLGYYSRARNLHRAAQAVVAEHGGRLPEDAAAIARLPGVGRYTAGAILSFGFDRPIAAVDANIARVLARLGNLREPIDSTLGQAAIWAAAEALLPQSHGREHTSALMELGALVCVARKPRCAICPVRDHCTAIDPETLPVKKARRKTIRVDEDCAWILQSGAVLLEQQTGPRWHGLWKLPALDEGAVGEPLFRIDYPFTHHVVTLRVFQKSAAPPAAAPAQRWVPVEDLDGIAFAAAHRRAVEALVKAQGGGEMAPDYGLPPKLT